MKKISFIALAIISILLTGCDWNESLKKMMDRIVPDDDDALALKYLDAISSRDIETSIQLIDPQLNQPGVESNLNAVADFLDEGAPISMELIGCNVYSTQEKRRSNLTYQYQFTNSWILASVVVDTVGDKKYVMGITVNPLPKSLGELNAFTLENKGIMHYLMLTVRRTTHVDKAAKTMSCALIPRCDEGWPVALKYAVVEVTNRCNLRCPHCASTSGRARKNEMTRAQIKAVFADLKALGCVDVALIGGEIFLRKDWRELCEDVVAAGLRLSVITNGLLLDKNARDFFKKVRPHVIGVSLDGADRQSYQAIRGVDGFDAVWQLLKNLKHADNHRNINAITTFMKDNLPAFDKFATLLSNTGINWQIQTAHQGGERFFDRELFMDVNDWRWMVSRIRHYMTTAREHLHLRTMDDFGYFPLDPAFSFLHQTWKGCGAGRGVLGIRSNGDVLGCLSLGDSFVEGNLLKTPLQEMWHAPDYFTRFRRKSENLTGHCKACKFAQKCLAGASCMALSATGQMGENPYCMRYQEQRDLIESFCDGDI